MSFGQRIVVAGVKFLCGFFGSVIALGVFWVVCRYHASEPPAWAWFIVGWMGHKDFYDAMTYKRDESWYE